MNKKIMLMMGLLALPLGTVALNSNPETAQAKIHYVHTPKALRGHYRALDLSSGYSNGKKYYLGSTYVVSKKYVTTGGVGFDTYPDRPVKVKTLVKYSNGKLWKIKLKNCIGSGYSTHYVLRVKVAGEHYLIWGRNYKQYKKYLKSPSTKYTYIQGKFPGIGYNY